MPPTIGAAIGFITSEPMPVSHKIGARLAKTATTVISFGRRRCTAPSMAALSLSASISPGTLNRCCSASRKYTTITTPVSTAIPNSAIYPIHIANDIGLALPHCSGVGSLGNSVILTFQQQFPIFDVLARLPRPQSLLRFLLHAAEAFWEQLHRVNDRLLQTFIHLPSRRSRLIFDLDSTVVTVFGKQEDAAVGYNPT